MTAQLDISYDRPLPESRKFDGETFEPAKDAARLGKQLTRVRDYMLKSAERRELIGSGWRTLEEISRILGYPEGSISARLRDLRKPKFGAYTVERRRVSGGLYEYRVSK